MKKFVDRYSAPLLLLILAFAFVTRVYRIHEPDRYVFDEVYHAVTAKLIAQNDPRAYEWSNPPPEPDTAVDWLHPPLAKLFQAISILAFGANTFGWRFSSLVFGVGVIWLVFMVAKTAFKNNSLALLASLLASLDGLLLVQSRIAMNDIHVTFFILLSCYWYLDHFQQSYESKSYKVFSKKLLLSIVASGLALASKWSGLFALGAVGFGELVRLAMALANRERSGVLASKTLIQLPVLLVVALIIPGIIYLLSYSQMFLQGKDFRHLIELHKQTWWYQTHLDATHPYQSRPWQWALDLRPVWFSVENYPDESRVANIYALGNPFLFWGGLFAVLSGIFYVTRKIIDSLKSKTKLTPEVMMILLLIVWYFIVWAPWFFSPRIMFFYHYAPAVPFLAILLASRLMVLDKKVRLLIVALVALFFVVWFPVFTGIPISEKFSEAVYFFTPLWR